MNSKTLAAFGILAGLALAAQSQQSKLQPRACNFIGETPVACDPRVLSTVLSSSKTIAVVAFEASPTWLNVAQHLPEKISADEYDQLRSSFFYHFVAPKVEKAEPNVRKDVHLESWMALTNKTGPIHKGLMSRFRSWSGTGEESKSLRAQCEKQMRQWTKFDIVSDPDNADLVVEVRRYAEFDYPWTQDQPVAFVLVWLRRADPEKDKPIWIEKYQSKWKRSGPVSASLNLLRETFDKAGRLSRNEKRP